MMDSIETPKPKKLLRIETSESCNYDCRFCCWRKNGIEGGNGVLLSATESGKLISAMVDSGCRRAMFTGGEPLLDFDDRFLEMVNAFAVHRDLTDFWITTNGSNLSVPGVSEGLAAAGLRKIVVSIAAADEDAYHRYSAANTHLDDILDGLDAAREAGIMVKVDVPLSKCGIWSFDQLEKLIALVRKRGVRELAYFQLHRTSANSAVFKDFFVPVEPLTEQFRKLFAITTLSGGQTAFLDGGLSIYIPARPRPETEACRRGHCGSFCQGVYAVYLTNDDGITHFRACHRIFADKRNEYRIDGLREGEEEQLRETFRRIWRYAYES
jgi:molybdenum cofactor biosynthesis enzyme MoaA